MWGVMLEKVSQKLKAHLRLGPKYGHVFLVSRQSEIPLPGLDP